jgi:hypothetical protein
MKDLIGLAAGSWRTCVLSIHERHDVIESTNHEEKNDYNQSKAASGIASLLNGIYTKRW